DVEVYIDGALVGRTNAECVLSVADVLPGQHRLKMVYGSSVKEQTVEVHRNSTFFHQEVDAMGVLPQDVIFQVEPATAVVTFDGEILSLDEGGAAFRTKRQGRYSYSVEAQDYHAESGQIVVAGDKVVKRITLRPAFGWLQVSPTTNLSGAKVYVDNRLVGTVPLSERVRLSSGTHALRIVKEKYKAYTSQVTIADSQTSTLTPSLAANFAVVSLTVADGAEIWINNERKGSGSWRGELALGTYRVETRKSGHRTSVESLDVATASPINRTLTAPSPIYGSLRIVSQPLMASVKVDGRAVGETPSTLSNLLIGQHTVEVSKAGYTTYKKSVTITEGQTANLNATLTKAVATSTSTSTSSSGNAQTSSGGSVPDFCEMVFVKGGTFTMGATSEQGSDAYDCAKPTHSVTVSDFYIGKYEVTQAQWQEIMGSNPSKWKGDDLPVENVSWDDIQTFITKLNQKTGRKYRLPTEAEWEYAARGGNKSQGYKYSGSDDISIVAWYGSNSGSETNLIGQ
ncbi:MAG: PEGA domain-containing protein, partial [Alistipes sp.]|nr:PEGA domain-containing protein [Alistipes sp.]